MEMDSYTALFKKKQKYKNQSNSKSNSKLKSKSKLKKQNNKKKINPNNFNKLLNISYDYIHSDSFEIINNNKNDLMNNLTISKTNSINYFNEFNDNKKNNNFFEEFTDKKDINNTNNYNHKIEKLNEEEFKNSSIQQKKFHTYKLLNQNELFVDEQNINNSINNIIEKNLIKKGKFNNKQHTQIKENYNINKYNNTNKAYKPKYIFKKLNIEDIADYEQQNIINNNQNNNYDFDNEQYTNKTENNESNIIKLNDLNDLKEKIIYYSKAEILHNTNLIFLNNSIYIKRKDLYMMTQENFRKIVKKVLNVIKVKVDQIEIDILFKKISKKSNYIIHSQFNDLLLELVKKIYPEHFSKNKKYTTNYFLNILFNCYKEILIENNKELNDIYHNKYNSILSLVSYAPNDNQILIINNIIFTINKVYENYFVYEFSDNPKIIKKSSKNLVEFCRDYEILSYIMKETEIITYYKLVINYEQAYNFFEDDTNKGILFTLNHFVLFLIHTSLYSYSKRYENKNIDKGVDNECSDESKLLLFLEKLQSSNGMKNFRKKMLRTTSFKLTFIPSEDIYYKVGEINPETGKFNKSKIINNILYCKTYY